MLISGAIKFRSATAAAVRAYADRVAIAVGESSTQRIAFLAECASAFPSHWSDYMHEVSRRNGDRTRWATASWRATPGRSTRSVVQKAARGSFPPFLRRETIHDLAVPTTMAIRRADARQPGDAALILSRLGIHDAPSPDAAEGRFAGSLSEAEANLGLSLKASITKPTTIVACASVRSIDACRFAGTERARA